MADDLIRLALGRERETLRPPAGRSRGGFLPTRRGRTAHGRAVALEVVLASAERVVPVEVRVERVQDHLADGRMELLDGARWRWLDEEFGSVEERIVAELARLEPVAALASEPAARDLLQPRA